jgi:LmbE family N-acetylglucosaminyl deacetylase
MRLHNPKAEIFIPDNASMPAALERTTHIGIGAHQDDLEIMAFHGILECFGRTDKWFTGVTCTNGAGSPRAGVYARHTDEMMQTVRRQEQRNAATVGQYAAMLQLDYPSSVLKDTGNTSLRDELLAILEVARPDVVYTHNAADKHETHLAVTVAALAAVRAMPKQDRPSKMYGCEVWRDLDWMPDDAKVTLDVSGRDNLAATLTGLFDSQIAGGKRYDLATMGRRRANATYFASHGVDTADQLMFAMDLTPLVLDDKLDVVAYVLDFIEKFRSDVTGKLSARLGR